MLQRKSEFRAASVFLCRARRDIRRLCSAPPITRHVLLFVDAHDYTVSLLPRSFMLETEPHSEVDTTRGEVVGHGKARKASLEGGHRDPEQRRGVGNI